MDFALYRSAVPGPPTTWWKPNQSAIRSSAPRLLGDCTPSRYNDQPAPMPTGNSASGSGSFTTASTWFGVDNCEIRPNSLAVTTVKGTDGGVGKLSAQPANA